jgi:hypothetical protein
MDDGRLLSGCGSGASQLATTPTTATTNPVVGAVAGEGAIEVGAAAVVGGELAVAAGGAVAVVGDAAAGEAAPGWPADAAGPAGEAVAVGVEVAAAAESCWLA